MFSLSRSRAWARVLACAVIFGTFGGLLNVPTRAHDGHDHGAPALSLPSTIRPRITVQSETYELVAVASGEQLAIFLDRFGSNGPVTDAKIEILLGSKSTAAQVRSDGSYHAAIPEIAAPGRHELVFSIVHHDGDDLLAGELDIPAAASGPDQTKPDVAGSPITGLINSRSIWLVIAGLLAGLVIGLTVSRRRVVVPVLAAIGVLLAALPSARAHDGHEPSPAPSSDSFSGDVPRRLADGSVFLPKASQRLVTVRTQLAIEGQAARGTTLVGRIISDPNRSGVVQSVAGGRVSAPEGGLPRLGQSVKKGDVLATVIPPLPLADQSTLAEKQRELEGSRLLAEQKLTRLNRLGPNLTPRSQMEDTELEIENLKGRLAILKETKIQPETLVAPVDGVISASRVVAGQVVQAQDSLFQIVDPQGLWVEALVFDQLDPGAITAATAETPDKTVLKLRYVGRGRALQQQAIQLQFSIDDAPPSAALGMPVTVIAKKAQTISGMLFPRDAIVRGTGGETIVWQHVEPERFVARPVRVEPFDGEQILITAGISPKDRIVVHGAELLSNVR
jgi:membrane fusion protein, heavy metal efflux system